MFLFGSSPGHATLGALGVWVVNTGFEMKRDFIFECFHGSRAESWAQGVYTRGPVSRYEK